MVASARLEFRLAPAERARIERAAALSGEHLTAFVRSAAEERAAQVLREHAEMTVVAPEFFDDLIAAFDAPPTPHPRLQKAVARLRADVVRE